ncbi:MULTISPECIES: hypothetical protein [unclassified Pseudoalteromonas]|jgi:hypothetical protein|uniref:hypothetical protein n=1 Tax=Pseudoalteromonas TaxID=53246 RepID=UPI0004240946|nr:MULTISPECIES: hypothetical protein [unclassified Pseudoalteromonas]MCP4055534.1 hypothetical protein [Mesoflavibacter sp.]|tara:strand:+ start:6015 stop:6569 length:555 start_codon:yes stop_codon:yes gene_type:complete
MVKYILGLLTGFCLTVWYLVFDLKFNFDHAFTLNLIIAAGTITATAIHFDSVRKQRKDRVWEINKESLIQLSKSLADAIEVSSKLSDQEFNIMNNIPDDTCTEGAAEINQKFQMTISDSLNVYKPLLNAELITAIEKYQQAEKNIESSFDHDQINVFEAYDSQWGAQKELQIVVSRFIKEVAGI